jgi:hypothetical protein
MRQLIQSANHFHKAARSRWMLFAALTTILLLSGCAEAGNMNVQPRLNPLSETTLFADGSSARPLVPNSVPYSADNSANSPVNTGMDTNGRPVAGFPQPVTQDLVAKGQERFNIYCTPYHGASGKGDGKVVTFNFPKPPDLLGSDLVELSNYEMFGAITDGFGKMLSYAYRVKPPERWAIIAYIRALQLKNGPVNPKDLTPADLKQIEQNP